MTRPNDKPIVLSLEQALSMPYGTLRFVHQGWRVIRMEPTPVPGRKTAGDPNRYIGRPVAGEDRHSYYVAPNVGKETLALNLKTEEGRELLKRLIHELPVDIFCTNTMPSRHKPLGIDYETLSSVRKDLIWCSISAMGHARPDVPGYDPAMQALCGYMDLTGERDGEPMQCGPPIIDLKAGDEVFAQVLLALLNRERTGEGACIDISMAHAAASWLQTFTPMLEMGSPPEEIRRNGNRHRQFIPVAAYPTSDGFVYVAIGSDAQWARFIAHPMFASLNEERFRTNEGRRASQEDLHDLIGAVTVKGTSAAVGAALRETTVPHSPITPIEEVASLDFFQESALKTRTPDGREIQLPPPAVSVPHLNDLKGELPFPPSYGEHTSAVLAEVGIDAEETERLRKTGIIA